MKISHLVHKNYPVVFSFQGRDAVRDMVLEMGYVVVMDEGSFKGLLTPKDIIRSPKNMVLDCLQEKPAVAFDQDIDSILRKMDDSGFDALPAIDNGYFKGVLQKADIVSFLSEYNQELEKQIKEWTKELQKINQKPEQEIKDRETAEEEKWILLLQMYQTEKAAAIGNLTAGIAHDFNNFLSPNIGFSEIAMSEAEPGTGLWNDIHEIHSAGSRAKELIQQLLRYARQGDPASDSVIEIKTVLDEGLKLIQSSFPASVTIRQDVETDALIKAEPATIHQIYMNLCTNALHALENECGSINIHAEKTRFFHDTKSMPDGILPGEYVKLSFSDNGIGILPENLNHVFDPYFTTKPAGKGTGLGLSTVFGIVKGYKGTIDIKSKPGQGTVVLIYLPVSDREQTVREKQSVQIEKGHEKILFVDDEEAITRLFKKDLVFRFIKIFTIKPLQNQIFSNGIQPVKNLFLQYLSVCAL